MTTAVIGAGYGGMAAAWDLAAAGRKVVLFEAAEVAGGLASGFREPGWDWSLEHLYHHWFATDEELFEIATELGVRDKIVFKQPRTVVWHEGEFFPLDSPAAVLRFPGFGLVDLFRFAGTMAWLRYVADWRGLEDQTAWDWLERHLGKRLHSSIFAPLLDGKFGPWARKVGMAWMWARLRARTPRLGTFIGGFQAFNDHFAESLIERGVEIRFQTPVRAINQIDGGLEVETGDGAKERFDQVLVTTSPKQVAQICEGLPADFLAGLERLPAMGAVVAIAALNKPLSPEGYYWYNIPKDAGFPFLAIVEHTNFASPEDFGGQHLIYIGDYRVPEDPIFDRSDEEILDEWIPHLQRINPDFDSSWVEKRWLRRTKYGQPVAQPGHSANVPPLQTPIPGVFMATMSQVYPWDRGTNYAIEIGRRAAKEMLA